MEDKDKDHVRKRIEVTSTSVALCPDVNTILDLVGRWVFDAAHNERKGFAKGRSEAIALLGRIFCNRAVNNEIRGDYLESYLSLVSKGLTSSKVD